MWFFRHQLESLVHRNLFGWLLVTALGAALVGSLVQLGVALFKRRRWPALVFTAITSGVAIAIAGVIIATARAEMLVLLTREGLPSTGDLSRRASLLADCLNRVLQAQYVATRLLSATAVLVIIASIRDRPNSLQSRLGLLATTLALVSFLTVLIRDERMLSMLGSGCVDVTCKVLTFSEAVAEGYRVIRLGKLALLGIGTIALATLSLSAVRHARRGHVASWPTTLAGGTLFGVGLLAIAATRAVAFDAKHPIPPMFEGGDCYVSKALLDLLPQGDANCAPLDAPIVELAANQTLLDAWPTASPAELEKSLRARRVLWQNLNPAKELPVHTLLIAAPKDQTVHIIKPWIEAAQRAGFNEIGTLRKVLPIATTQTATLGVMPRVRCCAAIWAIDSADKPFVESGTWGAVEEAASRNPRHLSPQ